MKFHGISLQEGSNVVNLTVASGTAFPSLPNAGELFYRTDADVRVRGLYLYLTSWDRIASADAITAPSDVNFPSLANVGDIFYKNSDDAQEGLYVYNGSAWVPSASGSGSTIDVNGDVEGELTVGGSGTLTLDTVSTAGAYGNAASTPSIEIDEKGRTTTITLLPIAIAANQVTSGVFNDARISESSVTQHEAALELSATQLTSGVLANARVQQSNVTQHQAALTIVESQITDGSLLARNAGNEVISGSWTFNNPVAGADPTIASHLATKQYVDNLNTGLDMKQSVRAATTTNITLSGTQTVDGVALVAGNRVLVKNQTTGQDNGIYVVAAGSWARSPDTDGTPANEVSSGLYTFVEEGTTNADSGWVLSTNDPITVGTTPLTFVQFTGLGQISAGAGLTKTGSTIDVGTASASRIVVNVDNIDLATIGTPGTYNSVTTDAYGRVSAGTVEPYATQAYVETEISKSVPAGAPGQVPFIAVDGTRESDIDYIVTTGAFTNSAAELATAQNNVVTNEDVFNTWDRFSHANLIGGTLTRSSNVGRFQFTSANLASVSASFPIGGTVEIVSAVDPTFNGTYTITSTGTSGSNHQIFFSNPGTNVGTGVAGSIDRDDVQPAFSAEVSAWNYDTLTDTITSTVNSDTYIGFVSDKKYTEYTLEAALSSTSTDDDTIGIVIAWYVDPNTGREHTLSVLRSPGGNSPTWAIRYDHGRSTVATIVDGTTLVKWGNGNYGANAAAASYASNTPGWGGMGAFWSTNGTVKVKVVRDNDIITVSTTQWEDPNTYYTAADLTVDLSQNVLLEKFRGPRSYGFSAISQANAKVDVMSFSDSANIIYDLETGDVYVYNTTTSLWEVDGNRSLEADIGYGRLLFNPDTKKVYYVREEGSVELISTATEDDEFVTRDGDTMYGPLVIGTASTSALQFPSKLEIHGDSTGTTLSIFQRGNTTNTSQLAFIKTRGTTESSRTAVVLDDPLGRIYFQGTDGTQNISAARIDGSVDGTVATNDVPGRLSFLTAATGGTMTERLRIGSTGTVNLLNAGSLVISPLVQAPLNTKLSTTSFAPVLQMAGGSVTTSSALASRWLNDTFGPGYYMAKSRGAAVGTHTIVQTNDLLGYLSFAGSDGTAFIEAARIQAAVNGTPGTNDMPGSLQFLTTPDGASSPLERMRIENGGNITFGGASAVAINRAGSAYTPRVQNLSAAGSDSSLLNARFTTDGNGPYRAFAKSRNATIGSHTIVQSADILGEITWTGSDGVAFQEASRIQSQVDGTPAAGSMPGRLVLMTTPTGATTPVERARITQAGQLIMGEAIDPTTVRGVVPQFQFIGNGTAAELSQILIRANRANAGGGGLIFAKSRASNSTTFTTVQVSDSLGTIAYAGANGTDLNSTSIEIRTQVEAISGSNISSFLQFAMTDQTGTLQNRLQISGQTGKIGINSTPNAAAGIYMALPITGGTTGQGMQMVSVIQSDVTTQVYGYGTALSTAAASFTVPELYHFIAQSSAFGAGSTVTSQTGFRASASLTGATNNYGFYSNITAGTGRWSYYVPTGNAVNYFGPGLFMGDSPTGLTTRVSTSSVSPSVEVSGTTAATSSTHVHRYAANLNGPFMFLSKSRGATPGAYTSVAADDELGTISFAGADGTQNTEAATIAAYVDGTPGASDMPGRLVFMTTPDGGVTPVERLRISSTGLATFAGGATVTGAFSAASQSVTHTLATSNVYTWSASNTDIDGLMAGTTAGVMYEGHSNGHFTIGIRSNDGNDAFAVLTKSAFGASYDKNVFNVRADGLWTFTGAGTAPSLLLNDQSADQLTIWRSASQYLTINDSAASTSPMFKSYSATSNAKPMVFNTTTDASDTALTAGALGFAFQVYSSNVFQISTNGYVTGVAGSAANPTYSFIGDPNTGMYNVADTSLNFSVNGANEFTLTSGLATFGGKVTLSSSGLSVAAWTTTGSAFNSTSGTVTDNSSAAAATVATRVANSFAAPTFASTNAITVTNATNVYVSGAAAAGTNTTITNAHAIHVAGGRTFLAAAGSATVPTLAIRDVNTGLYSSATGTLNITTAGTLSVTVDSAGNVAAVGAVTSASASAAMGYATGAGGSVTQATSKSTGVTLNRPNGAITMNGAALANATTVSFTLTNSTIGANDTVAVCLRSGATAGAYYVVVDAVAAGSCRISIRNVSGGSLSEAIVVGFAVINGSIT